MNQQKFDIVYKKILLDTFKFLIDFLNQNNLRWWGAYGTIIGAIRHHGVIPWDDDIDIFMPREDYEKLLSLKQHFYKSSDGHYGIEHPRTDVAYGSRFAKAMDLRTTIQANSFIPTVMGVFIDIFPLDSSNAEKEDLLRIKKDVFRAWTDYFDYVKHYDIKDFFKDSSINGKLNMLKVNCKNSPKKKHIALINALTCEKEASNVPLEESIYTYSLYGAYGEREIFESSWFSGFQEVMFEDLSIRIPSGYHELLIQLYGDYMTPPPVNKRIPGHKPYYMNLKERLTLEAIALRVKSGETIVW